MSFAAMMLVALAIDTCVGWPDAVFRKIGHPVTWIGRLIDALDVRLNTSETSKQGRVLWGAATVALVVIVATAPAYGVQMVLPDTWVGVLIGGVLAWPLVAARSLYSHVAAVSHPLNKGQIGVARGAVSMIVGRDPDQLDEAGIARAALESLGENASDGVVAPLFWGALLGLPGIAAYKAVNTLDSMIGHRTPRHDAFGRVAARLDDVANLAPARLTGLLIGCVASRPRDSLRTMGRDARAHRSPNAGWPEAALAGALGVRLSGPRIYADRMSDEPWLNGGAPDPTPRDVHRGLRLYLRAIGLTALILAVLAGWTI